MCGILAAIGTTDIELAKMQSAKLDHRGPDEQGRQVITSYPGGAILCHERLSII